MSEFICENCGRKTPSLEKHVRWFKEDGRIFGPRDRATGPGMPPRPVYTCWPCFYLIDGRLIQEQIRDAYGADEHYAWRMFVCCILLNRARIEIVRRIVPVLLERWPTPFALGHAYWNDVEELVRPLGFQRRRTTFLLLMSFQWDLRSSIVHPETSDRETVSSFTGVGRYAIDSWEIFVRGNPDVKPRDRVLAEHVERERRTRCPSR